MCQLANKDLDDINGQIDSIKKRVDKVEEDLKSDAHSNDDSKYEDDHNFENDQSSMNEKNKESDNENCDGGDETHKSKPHGNKRSQNMIGNDSRFEQSEGSTYGGELRKSIDRPLELKFNAQSKHTLLGQYNKNIHSKFSIETPFTTNESSTSTLINKLKINPDKNRSKKVSRAEMDSMMNIMSEILVKVNNNRMRLDTLEGNVDFKIHSLITEFKDEAKSEINDLQYEVRDDISKIHNRIGEFERLNYRINKKVLDKPYKYADNIKEALDKEQEEIKSLINRKYDMLLSRIVEIKNRKENIDADGCSPFNSRRNDNEERRKFQIDLENSKIEFLQSDIQSLGEKAHNEIVDLKKSVRAIESKLEEYCDKIDYQVYEFKSHTLQDLNNATKEFQNFEREMKRYKQIFRMIENQNSSLQSNIKNTIDNSNLIQSKKNSSKSRLVNISPLSKHKNNGRSVDRYKVSKSVIGDSKIKEKSTNFCEEVDSDYEDELNKTELPKISIKKPGLTSIKSSSRILNKSSNNINEDIQQTLKEINNTEKKMLRLKFGLRQSPINSQSTADPTSMKYISTQFKPVHKRGQTITPMKVDINSKMYVNLHKLF